MKKRAFAVITTLVITLTIGGISTNAAAGRTSAGNLPDTSLSFSVDNLPDLIVVDPIRIDQSAAEAQPRLKYLKITDLLVSEDEKTLEFSVVNEFDQENAKPIRVGGFMVTGMVRHDSDGGAALHNAILFKDKRMVFEQGSNSFKTDPSTYPHVTKIEKIQFYFMPPKAKQPALPITAGVPDTSTTFSVDNLPEVIVVDKDSIDQNAATRDPRLGYLKIQDLRVAEDGVTVEFSVENTFERNQKSDPIHVGELMVTGMARFDYDRGAELHNCIVFSEKRVAFAKGSNHFKSNPDDYPRVTSIEKLQFYFTPK